VPSTEIMFVFEKRNILHIQVFVRRFRDPIRVPRVSNRVPRIRENYHRVPKIRENRSLESEKWRPFRSKSSC